MQVQAQHSTSTKYGSLAVEYSTVNNIGGQSKNSGLSSTVPYALYQL